MRKHRTMLLCLLLCTALLPVLLHTANADDTSGQCGDRLTWTLSNGVLTITGTGDMWDFADEYPGWYSNRDLITTIVIDDGVTRIGTDAFCNCEYMSSITIPDSMRIIGSGAFEMCESLASIDIPLNVTRIGKDAFSYCKSLNSVTIPSSVTSIGGYAFYTCTSLESVTIQTGVKSILSHAFAYCMALKNVTIPESVSSIGEYAFHNCTSLESVTITDGVTIIGNHTFDSCASLENVTIPNSVTSIGDYAFYGCNVLSDVNYIGTENDRNERLTIGSNNDPLLNAGWHYQRIISIEMKTLPEKLLYRKNTDALDVIGGLIKVVYWGGSEEEVPLTVDMVTGFDNTQIDNQVLTVIYQEHTTTFTIAIYDEGDFGEELHWHYLHNRLTVTGNGDMENFNSASNTPWNAYRDRIWWIVLPSGLASVGDYAFTGMNSLSGVMSSDDPMNCMDAIEGAALPDALTRIGINAFSGCSMLLSASIPDSVSDIGEYAFANCSSLMQVNIPSSLFVIQPNTFLNCTSLSFIELPVSLGGVDTDAFKNCTYLQMLEMSATLTVNDNAFRNCSGLKTVRFTNKDGIMLQRQVVFNNTGATDVSVVLCEGIETVVDYAFTNCTQIASVTIPNSVVTIGQFAFEGCTSLTDCVIPDGVASIGEYAFANCIAFADVSIPESVMRIGEKAFEDTAFWNAQNDGIVYLDNALLGCKNTCPISISVNVRLIADGAFSSRTGLLSVTILGDQTVVGAYAFAACTGLKNVTIPCSAKLLDRAFVGCSAVETVKLTEGVGSMTNLESGKSWPWQFSESDQLSVTLNEGITRIGNYAFFESGNLTQITFPESLIEIGDCAFYECAGLTEVIFRNDGLTTICRKAFYNCTGLTEITIPDSVTSIGSAAFQGCTGLTSLTMPCSALLMVEGQPFSACNHLTDIRLTKGTGEMPDLEWNYGCTPWYCNQQNALTVILDEGITNIGSSTFFCCRSLVSITIPNSVISIDHDAFNTCERLTKVILPDSVTSIGNYAFNGCSRLTEIDISRNLTSIGSYAFSGCEDLTDVYYNGTRRMREVISVDDGNGALYNARWHYLPVLSIEMQTLPEKLSYQEGEALDLTGGVIKTYYDYEIVEEETLSAEMVGSFDNSKAGLQTLMVTFEGQTTTFDVTVSHVPDEPVHENETAPTCTETGRYDEVVYCAVCGDELSRETITVLALGHDLAHHDAQAPTCTEIGWKAYDTCTRCEYTTYTADIPAIGHDWGEPVYSWTETENGYTATAKITCLHDEAHVITEEGTVTYTVITEPTDKVEGLGRYTAVFENELLETQYYDVVIPALVMTLNGDVDCDGEVAAADAALILRSLVGLDTLSIQSVMNADTDRDGEITAADASKILRTLVGLDHIEN